MTFFTKVVVMNSVIVVVLFFVGFYLERQKIKRLTNNQED